MSLSRQQQHHSHPEVEEHQPSQLRRPFEQSNSMRIAQLSQNNGSVRSNPTPWAAQNRSVRFNTIPGSSLFENGATAEDVVQGQNGSRYLGDCWLLGSLAAIAHTQPNILEEAITDHGDGTYTVRLYKEDSRGSMVADDIRVEGSLPRTANGQDAYAQRQNPHEIWVGIIEEAFASWKGSYGALDGGIPSDALTALTGRSTETEFMNDAAPQELGEMMQSVSTSGEPMVAASRADLSLQQGGIVPGHAHTILDVSEQGGTTLITLRDPFAMYEPDGNGAKDGVFTLTLEEFQQRFQYASWTNQE